MVINSLGLRQVKRHHLFLLSCYLPSFARSLLDRIITIRFNLEKESSAVAGLIARYAGVPISLARACLIRMAQQHANGVVITLDSDFRVYRKSGRKVIPTSMPTD